VRNGGWSLFRSTVTHLALGHLILTLLVTLTGLLKAWKLHNQTKPNPDRPKSAHKSKKLSKSGSDHPFEMIDCIVKEILY
jgi:hypothetical protein